MLSGYARVQRMLDSLFAVQTRLEKKLNLSDTASMLSGYARVSRLLDSISSVQSKLNLKLNIKDTARLSARIDANKRGITDTAISIRSDLQVTNLAIQNVFTTNSKAIVDTGNAIRSALLDTARDIRLLLGEGSEDIRSALLDTTTNIRSALSDTATKIRSALSDTATHIRSALVDTTKNLTARIDSSVRTIGEISLTANSKGASISSGALIIAVATETSPGIVSTETQTFTGAKTFTTAPVLSSAIASQALFTDANKNIVSNPITGTGNVVMSTSPILVTPNIGAATGTSINVSGSLTSTVATGTAPLVVTSTTPVANLNIGGNAATVTTNANLTGPITSIGNTTSIASQTGTGTTFVMNTSPTLVTPVLGVAIATSVNKVNLTAPTTSATLTIADGKTLLVNNSLTLAGTDATTMTFPSTNATIASTDAVQTFTGTQTFISPIAGSITGNAATATSATSFSGSLSGDVSGTQSAAVVSKINGTSLAGLATGLLKNTTSTGVPTIATAGTDYLAPNGSAASLTNFPPLNQNTTGSAATLTTAQDIYGNSFNGTNNLTGVIASQYGGTGNGFAQFTGPTSSEKTFTLPNTSATILTSNAAVTVAQGGTGLTAAGVNGQVLTSSGFGTLTWALPTSISIGAIGTATTNAASITSGVLNLAPADGTNGGILTTGDQTIAGNKTFTGNISASKANVNGQTGIGIATPDASAKLDVSSTIQGFLPPRMTCFQKLSIASPATGLIVYCTDCGLDGGEPEYFNGNNWVNMIGGSAKLALPVVTTNPASNINANTADCGGQITFNGGGNIIESGICWSKTSGTESITGWHETASGSNFSTTINLIAGATYYLKAYATNATGTSYGIEITFTTLAPIGSVSVGQNYGGGVIAYFFQSGDPGYDANVPHGIIAATNDQSSGITWSAGNYVKEVFGTAIGSGKANTNSLINLMESVRGITTFGLCSTYNGGGFTDWFLPSIDELNQLYINRALIGNLTGRVYWSSSTKPVFVLSIVAENVYIQYYQGTVETTYGNDIGASLGYPTKLCSVRLVRYF
jgi:hypothetical protein